MHELYREYIILSLRLYIAQREKNKRTAKKINASINKVTGMRENIGGNFTMTDGSWTSSSIYTEIKPHPLEYTKVRAQVLSC